MPTTVTLISTALLGGLLIVGCIQDLRFRRIPNLLTALLAIAGLAMSLRLGMSNAMDSLLGLALGLAVPVVIALVYRWARGIDGLGGGDAKLLGAIGSWVAWQGVPSVLFLAACSGLLFTLAFVRHFRLTDAVAFGPHLALGGFAVWLFGPLQFG